MARTPSPTGPAPAIPSERTSSRNLSPRLYSVPRGAHHIEEHGRLGQGNVIPRRKEDVLVDEDVRPVTAIPVETYVAPLVHALVGKAQGATAALATEIHQVDHPTSAGRRSGLWPYIDHHPCRLVTRSYTRPVEVLAPFGPAQRVGPHPDQQLPASWFQYRLACETYLPSPQKPRNDHLGGYRLARHLRSPSELPVLDP